MLLKNFRPSHLPAWSAWTFRTQMVLFSPAALLRFATASPPVRCAALSVPRALVWPPRSGGAFGSRYVSPLDSSALAPRFRALCGGFLALRSYSFLSCPCFLACLRGCSLFAGGFVHCRRLPSFALFASSGYYCPLPIAFAFRGDFGLLQGGELRLAGSSPAVSWLFSCFPCGCAGLLLFWFGCPFTSCSHLFCHRFFSLPPSFVYIVPLLLPALHAPHFLSRLYFSLFPFFRSDGVVIKGWCLTR